MGKAKRTRSAGNRAEELRQRAERKRTARIGQVPDVPLWEYPELARWGHSQVPSASAAAALSSLFEYGVRFAQGQERPWLEAPAQRIGEIGVTEAVYVASYKMIHDQGLVDWDAEERIHRYAPGLSTEAIDAALDAAADAVEADLLRHERHA